MSYGYYDDNESAIVPQGRQLPSPYDGSTLIGANQMPLGLATCLRIVYWKSQGVHIDLPNINAVGQWASGVNMWSQKIQGFCQFPLGLPEAPFESGRLTVPWNVYNSSLWDEAKELLKDIHSVHAQLHHKASEAGSMIESLRREDPRVALEVKLIESLFNSESIKTMLAEYTAPRQTGGTCYANACAAAICHANRRILGRRGLSFEQLRAKMISQFGYDGALIEHVLDLETRHNLGGRLRWQLVNEEEARRILRTNHHPLVATFALNQYQWDSFSWFYRTCPRRALSECDIPGYVYNDSGSEKVNAEQGRSGHAVLATGMDKSGNLELLNSWGTEFADNGFFRIKNGDVLKLRFYQVYFLEEDIPCHEQEAYRLAINYMYAIQKVARGKNPYQPAIAYNRDVGRYQEKRGSSRLAILPFCAGPSHPNHLSIMPAEQNEDSDEDSDDSDEDMDEDDVSEYTPSDSDREDGVSEYTPSDSDRDDEDD